MKKYYALLSLVLFVTSGAQAEAVRTLVKSSNLRVIGPPLSLSGGGSVVVDSIELYHEDSSTLRIGQVRVVSRNRDLSPQSSSRVEFSGVVVDDSKSENRTRKIEWSFKDVSPSELVRWVAQVAGEWCQEEYDTKLKFIGGVEVQEGVRVKRVVHPLIESSLGEKKVRPTGIQINYKSDGGPYQALQVLCDF